MLLSGIEPSFEAVIICNLVFTGLVASTGYAEDIPAESVVDKVLSDPENTDDYDCYDNSKMQNAAIFATVPGAQFQQACRPPCIRYDRPADADHRIQCRKVRAKRTDRRSAPE